MTPQKERERFEEYFKMENPLVNHDTYLKRNKANGAHDPDAYVHGWVDWQWIGFQAGVRAALADAEQEVTLVDHGSGNLTGMFATPMPNANYSVEVSAIMDAGIHEPSGMKCKCNLIAVQSIWADRICGKPYKGKTDGWCSNLLADESDCGTTRLATPLLTAPPIPKERNNMHQLTELQEKWLKALESGEYRQTTGVLHDGIGYCCLGLLCKMAGATFELSEPDEEERENGEDRDVVWRCGGIYHLPPEKVWKDAGLHSQTGQIIGGDRVHGERFLTSANDGGATFVEIATVIRANPQNFFLLNGEKQP
jgi:hypothetical protein